MDSDGDDDIHQTSDSEIALLTEIHKSVTTKLP